MRCHWYCRICKNIVGRWEIWQKGWEGRKEGIWEIGYARWEMRDRLWGVKDKKWEMGYGVWEMELLASLFSFPIFHYQYQMVILNQYTRTLYAELWIKCGLLNFHSNETSKELHGCTRNRFMKPNQLKVFSKSSFVRLLPLIRVRVMGAAA